MKYYTETIPVTLAKKLKEKGMSIDIDCDTFDSGTEYQKEERWCYNTYAEVFDWLMGKGISISVAHIKVEGRNVCWYPIVNGKNPPAIDGRDWEHSAELAIEKALELI